MNEVNHVCSFPEFSPPIDMYKNVKKKKKKTQGPCISQESGKEAIRWHRGWMKDSLDAMDGFRATRKVCQFTKSKARAAVLVLGLKVQEEVVLLKACECQLPEEQQELGQELYSQRRAAFSEMGSRSGREEKYPNP